MWILRGLILHSRHGEKTNFYRLRSGKIIDLVASICLSVPRSVSLSLHPFVSVFVCALPAEPFGTTCGKNPLLSLKCIMGMLCNETSQNVISHHLCFETMWRFVTEMDASCYGTSGLAMVWCPPCISSQWQMMVLTFVCQIKPRAHGTGSLGYVHLR